MWMLKEKLGFEFGVDRVKPTVKIDFGLRFDLSFELKVICSFFEWFW